MKVDLTLFVFFWTRSISLLEIGAAFHCTLEDGTVNDFVILSVCPGVDHCRRQWHWKYAIFADLFPEGVERTLLDTFRAREPVFYSWLGSRSRQRFYRLCGCRSWNCWWTVLLRLGCTGELRTEVATMPCTLKTTREKWCTEAVYDHRRDKGQRRVWVILVRRLDAVFPSFSLFYFRWAILMRTSLTVPLCTSSGPFPDHAFLLFVSVLQTGRFRSSLLFCVRLDSPCCCEVTHISNCRSPIWNSTEDHTVS